VDSYNGNRVVFSAFVNDILIWNKTAVAITTSLWYHSGDISVNLPGIGSQFEFRIGMSFKNTLTHTKQFITFLLDNIHLVGATPPTFDDSDIELNIGSNSTLITGTNTGVGSIDNEYLWQTEQVLIELTSDLGYSFDYTATMLSHRYTNSTKSLSLLDDGVHFTTELNTKPQIEFYTFIGVLPALDDFTLYIRTPSDWTGASVYNPFGTNVTTSCNIETGMIVIPNSLLTTLGWWEFHAKSPNYARKVQPLIWTETIWIPDTIYWSTNKTKPMIEIGDAAPLSSSVQDVNISWIRSDDTTWYTEVISNSASGVINGTALEFGSGNTTVGVWKVVIYWENGTELAFGSTNFAVYHEATISPVKTVINAEGAIDVPGYIYYSDAETGTYLVDTAATITANWSSTIVTFSPVPLDNKWSTIFDTALVGPGSHTVVVTASRPFFNNVTCTFVIAISSTDNVLIIDNPTTELGIGDTFLATFSYTDANGTGIPNANVSVVLSGTPEGITWTEPNDLGDGEYSIVFKAIHSDSYVLTISAVKEYYHEGKDALFVLVGETSTSFSLENGTSAVISFGEQYRLVIRYTNGTGFGLENANVSVLDTTPNTGIIYAPTIDEGNGYYSILLTPTDTGTYTLLINASLPDHTTQLKSFTLTATPIATQIQIAGGAYSASVKVFQPFELLVFFEEIDSTPANISGATVHLNFTSLETFDYTIVPLSPLSDGYLIQISTDVMGSYEFTISASADGYQSDIVDFVLFIVERAMRIEMNVLVWERNSDLNITLLLLEVDTDNPISGANVTYRLSRLLGVVMEGYLNEVSPGVYSIFIRPNWGDGTGYSIQIFAEMANFELERDYNFDVIQITPPGVLLEIAIRTYLPPILLIAAMSIVSLTGRTWYKRKKKAEFVIDMVNKKRFEDADNIIGVIVMHKTSGIPIYSRIVKGGFEEGIVAAFIAAVTHFREEFELLEEQEMQVIPISDIIRAVQTRNLICAFITVRSASIEHNRKMEAFGMQIATYLDDFYNASTPQSAQDMRISEIVDYVYDETMDGNLLKFYKISESMKFSKRYTSIKQVFQDMESAHCSRPIYLAKAVSRYGVSEEHGCTLVSEVIEKRLLTPCEQHEIPTFDVDLASFLGKDDSEESE
ncbi:MAG: hypothetical protein ACFFFK_10495, partial [Candidatus Thorarchaeota archaeon]